MSDQTLFAKCWDNCERMLEQKYFGWSAGGLTDVRCPVNTQRIIDDFFADHKIRPNHSTRPDDGSIEMLQALKELNGIRGSLYVKFGNIWAAHYA